MEKSEACKMGWLVQHPGPGRRKASIQSQMLNPFYHTTNTDTVGQATHNSHRDSEYFPEKYFKMDMYIYIETQTI